jgi:hypothetical protein
VPKDGVCDPVYRHYPNRDQSCKTASYSSPEGREGRVDTVFAASVEAARFQGQEAPQPIVQRMYFRKINYIFYKIASEVKWNASDE